MTSYICLAPQPLDSSFVTEAILQITNSSKTIYDFESEILCLYLGLYVLLASNFPIEGVQDKHSPK